MPRATTWITAVAVLWAVAFTVRVEETRLARERERTGAAMLAASNLAASRDSTREVARSNARVARVLGDSLRLVERRVQQVGQRTDALDRALGRERVARYAAVAVLDSLERMATAGVDTTAGPHVGDIRAAVFKLRNPPYTISADVEMPPPPDSANIRLRIALDPIPIEARVSCAPPKPSGIHEATVSVSTPNWATVRLGMIEQSPGVCASPALSARHAGHSSLVFHRLIVGAGRAYTENGAWRWAVFVGGGFVFWT